MKINVKPHPIEVVRWLQRIKKEHRNLYWDFYGHENGIIADTAKQDIEQGYIGRIAVIND